METDANASPKPLGALGLNHTAAFELSHSNVFLAEFGFSELTSLPKLFVLCLFVPGQKKNKWDAFHIPMVS